MLKKCLQREKCCFHKHDTYLIFSYLYDFIIWCKEERCNIILRKETQRLLNRLFVHAHHFFPFLYYAVYAAVYTDNKLTFFFVRFFEWYKFAFHGNYLCRIFRCDMTEILPVFTTRVRCIKIFLTHNFVKSVKNVVHLDTIS